MQGNNVNNAQTQLQSPALHPLELPSDGRCNERTNDAMRC